MQSFSKEQERLVEKSYSNLNWSNLVCRLGTSTQFLLFIYLRLHNTTSWCWMHWVYNHPQENIFALPNGYLWAYRAFLNQERNMRKVDHFSFPFYTPSKAIEKQPQHTKFPVHPSDPWKRCQLFGEQPCDADEERNYTWAQKHMWQTHYCAKTADFFLKRIYLKKNNSRAKGRDFNLPMYFLLGYVTYSTESNTISYCEGNSCQLLSAKVALKYYRLHHF